MSNPIHLPDSLLSTVNQNEHFLGNPDAAVTVIEYASFSCLHCADFNKNVLPLIKNKYIDNGKVLFIFRDLPTDPFSFKASMIAHCYAPNPIDQKFFDISHHLFQSLREWAFKKDFLEILLPISRLDPKTFNDCINNKTIENMIIRHKLEAVQLLGIQGLPSFIINNKLYRGKLAINTMTTLIDAELQKH